MAEKIYVPFKVDPKVASLMNQIAEREYDGNRSKLLRKLTDLRQPEVRRIATAGGNQPAEDQHDC